MIAFNPAIALITAFLYSCLVSFSSFDWYYILPLIFLLVNQYKNIGTILKKLLILNLFIFVLFIVLFFESGMEEALNVYLRANAIILLNITLFFSSKGYDIVRALYVLHFPKVFVSSVYFTLKMITFLHDDFKQLKMTLKARGFKAQSSLFAYETFGNMLGLLFVKSLRKANALQNTFILRGFNGMIYLNESFTLKLYDYLLLGVIMILIFIKAVA